MRVLIVRTGSVSPSVRVALGDYDRWFVRSLPTSSAHFRVTAPHLGEPLPGRARAHDAILVTGSSHSVLEALPWMRETAAWLRAAAEDGVPVLGVCFGHQLLAWAYGARVRRSPRGRELGTATMSLTDAGRADPLFEGVPDRFAAQATHEDEVVDPPPALRVLATNAHSAIQAFRVGAAAAVQFHPEVDAATMAALVEARVPALEAEARARGLDPLDRVRAVRASIGPAPAGPRILASFVAGARRGTGRLLAAAPSLDR